MHRKQEEKTSLRVACAIVVGGLSAPAASEDAAPVVSLGKVDVTGTNIKRTEGESGLPVQVITREELQNGGIQTTQDILDRISANQSFNNFTEAKGEGDLRFGFTAASLRGLGFQRTLVLLNGRRIAPYALSGGQSVDLSGIPVTALERVEILKDGASAVYGTDAIGGVINFILRKDYQGIEAYANYYATEHGGGNSWRANATLGYGDLAKDKLNVFISADYLKQQPLKASEREISKTAYLPGLGLDRTSMNSFPANIEQPGGFASIRNPTIPFPGGAAPGSCLPPFSFPTANFPYQCRFDFASVIETIPESEKTSVIGRFAYQFNRDHQFFAEGSYYGGKFTQRVSPTPVATPFFNNEATLPASSPYYPASYIATLEGGNTNLPIGLYYRTIELGPRVDEGTVTQWRGVAGLQGTVEGWDYTLAANYTANRETDKFVSGYLSETAFAPLIRSGVLNPFGPNTPAVLALMHAAEVHGQGDDNRATNYGGDFRIAKPIYRLPAGSVDVAFGAEARRESLEQTNSDYITNGDIVGGTLAIPSVPTAYRTVWSLFGEVNIPIVKSFEANVAVRYDHYSDFGSTTNPKLTLRWQPAQTIVLRGSYGIGFRAPTLSDLFQPLISGGITGLTYDDPIRCPVTHAAEDCDTQFGAAFGGNRQLQPEKSNQLNAGIVWEPVAGLSASVDYFWVEVKNVIVADFPEEEIFANYARWAPTRVVRKPPDAQYPNLPGPIDHVILNSVNVGKLQTSGIDLSIEYRAPATPFGQFTASLNGTYVIDYKQTTFDGTQVVSYAGKRSITQDGAIARWRHYAQLNWTQGPWGATLANTYQTGYNEPDLPTCDDNGVNCAERRVGSYSIWDLQGRYTGFKNLTLTFGIRNLADTRPPVSSQGYDFQVGYDPSYADPRGRTYYGAIRYVFK